MMRDILITLIFVGLFSCSAFGGLVNGGFESDGGWVFPTNSDITGSYVTSWSSEGAQSYQFYRNTGITYAGYYSQISQQVDLTSVTGLTFDCQDKGIDSLLLQFLVDNSIVGEYSNNGHNDGGTSWGSTAVNIDIEIDFEQEYNGVHDFAIRLQEIGNYYPADEKIYRIDNMQFTPEPASLFLLVLGGVVLKRRK